MRRVLAIIRPSVMNDDNSQLIEELRNLTQALRRVRRSSNIALILCVVLVVGFAIYLPLRYRSIDAARRSPVAKPAAAVPETYESVRSAIDRLDYDQATQILKRFVQRYPSDYYGFAYLGNIALATGHLKDAEGYYSHAYELLPSEDHEKLLSAVRKRIEKEKAAGHTIE
jgi:cytochrome c-type biogenesis protein CcmH/NrfG